MGAGCAAVDDQRRNDTRNRHGNDLYVEPMLATLVREPFDDPDWLFETKWDGFRVEACIAGGAVRLWTRGRKDAAGYFGAFLSPPTWLDAEEAIIDGEVVALDEHGEPDFGLLQQRIGRSGAPPPIAGWSTRRSTCCTSMAPA